MTNGSISKKILGLAMPLMASAFLGTLYNICDLAWVGTLGAKTVAGVGVGGMFLWLASGLAVLPKMGGQVLTAQALGAEEEEKARACTKAAIHVIVVFGLLFGLLSLLFTKQMVGFFQLGDDVSVSTAIKYIRITCGLIIFNFMNLTLSGLYTADGNSKTPMKANFIGLILNMILDPLLIMGPGFLPKLGAVGAAAATVCAQFVVTAILLLKMTDPREGSRIFREQKLLKPCSAEIYRNIFRIGTPASIQSMVFCFISMILTRFISGFGPEAVAVTRVGGQIESISWNTGDGFASALNSFCGQNYGAGKTDRIRKGYAFSAVTTFLWGVLVLLLFVFLPHQISTIFFHEEKAILLSSAYLFIVGISEPFLMVEIITSGALSGLGRTRLCSVLTIIMTGIRIPLAFVLKATPLGVYGIWWALTITSILKGIVFFITFVRQKI